MLVLALGSIQVLALGSRSALEQHSMLVQALALGNILVLALALGSILALALGNRLELALGSRSVQGRSNHSFSCSNRRGLLLLEEQVQHSKQLATTKLRFYETSICLLVETSG